MAWPPCSAFAAANPRPSNAHAPREFHTPRVRTVGREPVPVKKCGPRQRVGCARIAQRHLLEEQIVMLECVRATLQEDVGLEAAFRNRCITEVLLNDVVE